MDYITLIGLVVTSTFIYSTPLILTSLGAVFSERSGIINVGLEGIMLMGAFSAITFNLATCNELKTLTPWIAILVGGIVGLFFSLIHAFSTINLKINHIVSSTAVNLIASGLSLYLTSLFYGGVQTNEITFGLGYYNFPLLEKIFLVGPIFFQHTFLPAYIAFLIAFLSWFLLFKTRFGLRLRSVGENPQTADFLGIKVYKYRYLGVLFSGFLGGVGGGLFAQSISGNFSSATIMGQGFISIAVMILGKWNPIGAMLGALFFGFVQSLSIVSQQLPFISYVSPYLLKISPYLLTIFILAFSFNKACGPKSGGQNYIRSK